MNKMNEMISIIVPVYNVEKYLKRCIDSIINQTYKNIEIILVDDGSPDKCPEICDEYAKKDERIHVIHKENGGLSDARNVGVKHSHGKYLFFVDSDDSIENDTIEYLYSGVKKYKAKIICCGFSNIYMNGVIEKITRPQSDIIYSRDEALGIHLLPGYVEDITCNKLFDKDLFNDIEWPIGLLYEDMRTTYKLINKTDKIVLMPQSKYNYYKRETSIGGSAFNSKTLDLISACDEAVKFVNDTVADNKLINISQIHWYIVVMNKMILSNQVDKTLVRKIKRMILKNLKYICFCEYLTNTRKIQFILFYINFNIYKKIYVKYIKDKR